MEIILTTLIIPLLIWVIKLYYERGRLNIKIQPNSYFYLTNACSPILELRIFNSGTVKKEINSIKIELKKGSVSKIIKNDDYWKKDYMIPAKSTLRILNNCESIFKSKIIENFTLLRIVAITTDDKRYISNWVECDFVKEVWSEAKNRANKRNYL